MPKVVFEFETAEERDFWLSGWYDGGGDNEMYNFYECHEREFPEIKITEED